MADPTDLTSLDTLKAWLGLTTVADDAVLGLLITATSGFITQWLGRPILEASFDEVHDGPGGSRLILQVSPIASVQSVTIDGLAIPATGDVRVPGYLFDATRIALVGYRFTRGLGNVEVVYVAGYATVPPAVEQACIALASMRYRERERIGLKSRGLAGETTFFQTQDMPADVATLLQQYRKVTPPIWVPRVCIS